MPAVKRLGGFVIKINTRGEHLPPHVHVIKAGGEIRVKLGNEEATPPCYWDEKRPMSLNDKVKAVLLVDRYHDECLAVWRKFNGHLG